MANEDARASRSTAGAIGNEVELTIFADACKYLLDRADVERMRASQIDRAHFKLDRTRALLAALDDPHGDFESIHVAGTVGKGSIVTMIASMMQACGYVVGAYVSPHLIDIRERVLIDGQMMPHDSFAEHVREVAAAAETLDFRPTFFELMTALAFRHFAEEAVDIAVIEVGLGGRLDCTNVMTPKLSIIGRIDFDHMHILGNTLEQIAREKAGILKKDVPAISVPQEPVVERVLRDEAERIGAPIAFVDKEIEFSYRFGASSGRGPHAHVCVFSDTSRFEHVAIPLPGEHQAFNGGAALAAIDMLKSMGFKLTDQQVLDGLAQTTLEGRMELIWQQPRVVIDGAHNPAALYSLFRGLGAHAPYDSLVCIFGCCEDKDVGAMLDALSFGGDKVIFTKASDNPRAADPHVLCRMFQERCGKMGQVEPSIQAALTTASRAIGREDLICVTGSFYLIGETKKYLQERGRQTANA